MADRVRYSSQARCGWETVYPPSATRNRWDRLA